MAKPKAQFPLPVFSKRILIIVGGYGSGKSEVSVNLARHLATSTDRPVAIADLDIVNPYFRSREASRLLEQLGIEPVHPGGSLAHADLPIIIPRIKGAVEQYDGTLVLDVGGDDVGARVLSSLTDSFPQHDYDLLLVLNANRPFTSTVDACLSLMKKIETASRLKFSGIISNTHMLEYTTADTVRDGLTLARSLSAATGLRIAFVSALTRQLEDLSTDDIDVPVLPLERLLLKPWERGAGSGPATTPKKD